MSNPADIPAKCDAELYIADDFGDNEATMRCELPAGHSPPHQETLHGRQAWIMWNNDERRQSKPE